MKKISFKNDVTKVNAETFKTFQNNIEEAVVPEGGTTGQVLTKSSNEDNKVNWTDPIETQVINSLNAESTTSALSAYQGKVLNNRLMNIEDSSIYSTEETKVGTWIDGKPIYRKVIEYSTQPASESNTFYHGISNVDKFIDIETKIYRKDGVQHFAPRYTPGENSWNFYYDDITKTKIAFNCGSQLRSGTYWGTSYFIFEYTKTTD